MNAPIGSLMWLWQLEAVETGALPAMMRARARKGIAALRAQLGEAHPTLMPQRHVSSKEPLKLKVGARGTMKATLSKLDLIIARYHANALSGIVWKVGDGEWRWSRQWYDQLVAYLARGGVRLIPWIYSVGNWQGPAYGFAGSDGHDCTIAAEMETIDWALNVAELAGYAPPFVVIDPEKEACLQGQGYGVEYGRAYRARFGDLPLYAATVPSETGYWVGNPLRALAEWVDGFMPQVYTYSWQVEPENWTPRAVRLSYGKPCYPIYESSSGAPADYMARCIGVAASLGLSGVSWWDWQHCTLEQWGGVATAAALGGGGIVPARTPLEDVLGVDWLEAAEAYRRVLGR